MNTPSELSKVLSKLSDEEVAVEDLECAVIKLMEPLSMEVRESVAKSVTVK